MPEESNIRGVNESTNAQYAKDKPGILPGEAISLNFARASFFGVPGLELTADKPSTTVPDNISQYSLRLIDDSIRRGRIIRGLTPRPRVSKNVDALVKFVDGLARCRQVEELHIFLIPLLVREDKRGGYGVHEVLDYLLKHERSNQARSSFLEYLNRAKDKMPGHSKVTDIPGTGSDKTAPTSSSLLEPEELPAEALDKI